jgi:hypothetical protein
MCFFPFNISGDSRQIHPGRPSLLEDFQDVLVCAVFGIQEQGLQVNTRTV